MPLIRSLFLLGIMVHQTLGSPAWSRAHKAQAASTGKAIYFLTNDAQQNTVIAIPIGADGTLSGGSQTSTGGAGASGIEGSTNKTAGPDALFSQSSLTLAGSNLFAVNAGSNTVSMLAISAADATKLTLVGQPAAVQGDFPNTVAASALHSLVCAGTTGIGSGVSCASFCSSGIGAFDTLRPFDLGQTNPPVGPTNTVSQVLFSADESSLFATVKGNGTIGRGFFSVFPVEVDPKDCSGNAGSGAGARVTVSSDEVRSTPSGSAVLFGAKAVPGSGSGSVFTTDASFGAGLLSINADENNTATFAASTPISGQKATCWATISPSTGTAFVTDVGVDRLVEMNVSDASIIAEYDLSKDGDPGLIDLAAAGQFVYALSPGNGTTLPEVVVMDLSAGPGKAVQIQAFKVQGLGATANSMGMAVLS